MHDKYNLSSNDEQNVSTYFCQSGSILGNPFLLCKDYKQDMSNKEYTGTLTIHWTTRVKTKEGYRTEHHSQTLVATIYKPAPVYSYQTYLIYGNDAAPKLEFSRLPSNASGKSEREIDKIVKNRVKDLDKLAKNAVNDGKNYTRFGNDEFEALFGGENRNNEVEYRLLFTPLAQKNLLELIKDPEPYGDDFIFQKDRQLNYIMSRHSQGTDYYSNPANFIDFDYERAKEKFINYNKEYFKALYYDFAPLISIPLYQQHKSFEYIYDKEYIYEEFSENLAFGIKNFLKGDRFDLSVFGTTEWFCQYDEQLAKYINEPDEANFEPFLAGGEEDYEDPSNNIESFCRQKRTNKIKGIFFRLRVENKDRVTGKIDSDRKKDWVSYIKQNEKETLEFLKERKEEAVTYFKIMKEERILAAGNISYFIDGMAGPAFTESKAYLLKEQENLSVEDVWKQFQI